MNVATTVLGRCMRLALAAVLLLATHTLARTRNREQVTPVCQGEYSQIKPVANGTTKSSPLDRWRMYAMPDGNYNLEVQRLPLSEPFRVDERHIFTKTMEPLSADLVLPRGAKIHCDYELREIACNLDGLDGTSARSSRLPQLKPYAFAPAYQVVLTDIAWFDQMVVVQANRTAGGTTSVPLVTILNNEKNNDEVKLTAQRPAPIESLGSETIDILNQRVSALRFRMRDSTASGSEDSTYLWMSKSGLLLQVTSDKTVITKLSSYQGPAL
jgi:hypothetical protein